MTWVYIFEDCDFCRGRGQLAMIVDGKPEERAKCDLCEGKGRRPTNMSFHLPATLLYPGGVNEELAAP
jgi:hypothetical protein